MAKNSFLTSFFIYCILPYGTTLIILFLVNKMSKLSGNLIHTGQNLVPYGWICCHHSNIWCQSHSGCISQWSAVNAWGKFYSQLWYLYESKSAWYYVIKWFLLQICHINPKSLANTMSFPIIMILALLWN